jgi:hypothetical protein
MSSTSKPMEKKEEKEMVGEYWRVCVLGGGGGVRIVIWIATISTYVYREQPYQALPWNRILGQQRHQHRPRDREER